MLYQRVVYIGKDANHRSSSIADTRALVRVPSKARATAQACDMDRPTSRRQARAR